MLPCGLIRRNSFSSQRFSLSWGSRLFGRFCPYTLRSGLGCQLLRLGRSFQLLLLLSWLQSCFSVGCPTGLAESPWLSLGSCYVPALSCSTSSRIRLTRFSLSPLPQAWAFQQRRCCSPLYLTSLPRECTVQS